MAKSLRGADATTRKLCSPQHVWDSTHPNKYRDAIKVLNNGLQDQESDMRFKCAREIINHTKGTPSQSVDLTSGGDKLESIPATLQIKIVD
jgi:hypothetical protein